MKLISFKGENVRGYLKYDISFRDDLTFLIGMNGCGKTTVIKIISYLLTPNFYKLCNINFENIELNFEDKQIFYRIKAKQTSTKITFELKKRDIEYAPESYMLLSIFENRYQQNIFVNEDDEPLNNIEFQYMHQFESSKILMEIRKINTPIILGLDRRNVITLSSFTQEQRLFMHRSRNRKNLVDNVDMGLQDIQDLIHLNIREMSEAQENVSKQFRDDVLKVSLKISDIPSVLVNGKKLPKLEVINQKEDEFNNVINSLELDELKKSFKSFFSDLKTIIEILNNTKDKESNEYMENSVKWVINSSQLEKINQITKLGIDYREQIEKFKEKNNRFLNSVNLFFKESGKSVIIDKQGDIKIVLPNGKENSIFDLSSGEKQLIILLGHLAVNKNQLSGIYIIDEPELSLHLAWQEMFVKALREASPSTQFILATHAPAIIANSEWQKCCEDLTQKAE